MKPSDISEAVRESRKVVRGIEKWSDLLGQAAQNVYQRHNNAKVKKGALVVAIAADAVNEKVRVMTGRGKR